MPHNPLLLLALVPIAAGILCLPLPDKLKNIIKALALSVTSAALAGSIFVFMKKPLCWQSGPYMIFIADNLAAFIGIGIAIFAFLVTIYSFGFVDKAFGRYFGYILITLGSSFGAAFANDLIVFLVAWGILAVMLYLLVNMQGTDRAAASSKKALIIIGGTDAIMVFGVCLIWYMTGIFSIDKIHIPLKSSLSYIAYLSLAIAGFAKAGAMPFHSWLPDVAEDGPTTVTAYLPASLDKLLGIYLLARASLTLFVMTNISNFILALVGSVTIILAVMIALVQHDLKRLLGYHAVSQVGYMILGIGTGNPIGIAGGLFHMVNNTVYKSCLFLSGGNVEKKTGTTSLSKLGGLAKYMPVTFACFKVASLSISGIPPFNGFVSKWMIYQGIIESANGKSPFWIVWLVCAMFGSALTIASFMKLIHAIFLGRPSKDLRDLKEAPLSMTFPIIVLAAICFIFGVFAFVIPLPMFIAPSLGISMIYLGLWSPVIATILIIIGIIASLFIYLALKPAQNFRTVASFVGGEEPAALERVAGTEFYDTIKDIKLFGAFYKKEEEGSLDIYAQTKNGISFFTKILQYMHNGILPTYMVWCLLGMIGMFFILFFK